MPASKSGSPAIEPESQYRITFSRKIVVGELILLPRHDVVVKGDFLMTIQDQVDTFVKLD